MFTLSNGQGAVEGGFFVNKELLVENLQTYKANFSHQSKGQNNGKFLTGHKFTNLLKSVW